MPRTSSKAKDVNITVNTKGVTKSRPTRKRKASKKKGTRKSKGSQRGSVKLGHEGLSMEQWSQLTEGERNSRVATSCEKKISALSKKAAYSAARGSPNAGLTGSVDFYNQIAGKSPRGQLAMATYADAMAIDPVFRLKQFSEAQISMLG